MKILVSIIIIAGVIFTANFFDLGSKIDLKPPINLQSSTAQSPNGLKKCVQGSQVIYTDTNCPVGFKDSHITTGNVTILPSVTPSTSSASPTSSHTANELDGQKRLHKALDLQSENKIQRKDID